MEEDGPTASIIFIIILLINLLIYGFVTAIEYLNEKDIEKKALEDQDKNAILVMFVLNDPKRFKQAVQMVILLSNMLIGYLCIHEWVPQMKALLDGVVSDFSWQISEGMTKVLAAIIVFAAVLYVTMIFTNLVPKKLAKTYPESWAYTGVGVVRLLQAICRPFMWFVRSSAHLILILLGVNPNATDTDVTEEEIIDMVNEGQEQGIIEAAEAEMISNIFEYREKEAQDIMTQRNNIIALDGSMLLKDAIDEVINGKQSRYPVYEENIDHIIGILHLKDAMRYHADHEKLHTPLRKLADLLREPVFIPQTRNIDELFKEMQSNKLQMVIVIDEYGQTTGLVAMEDILEEIVGNIMDEYDEETEYIEDKGNDEYIIEGLTPLEELEERFNISFGDVEFETLNGFLISKMDKIPEENEEFEIEVDGYHFKIISVENKMIHSVLVTRKYLETKVEEE